MSKRRRAAAPETQPAERNAVSARLTSIDILRGLAILWVMTFHLWGDMTFHYGGQNADWFPKVRDRALEGSPLPVLASLGELVLSQGYLGVSLFMMLSGLSLTLNAYRRPEPGILRGYAMRFRRVLVVYWGGVLLILSSVAMVALLEMLLHGGSYQDQWFDVRIAVVARANILWQDLAWALTVVGWVFRDKLVTVPVDSLWFVELLLQYYLIFPFALVLLKRIGPWNFALTGIAITLAARSVYVPWARESVAPVYFGRYLDFLSPLRASEFFIGMSIGYLLACRRGQVSGWVRSPLDIGGLVVIGVMFLMAGVERKAEGGAQLVASDVMVHVGLALVITPLLFKVPGRLEVSVPARALVFTGIVSFTALIVNDMMRYVASFLRVEGVTGPVWWFFLWVIYIPVGVLLAYPLARIFGLLPNQRASVRGASSSVAETIPPAAPGTDARRRGVRSSGSGKVLNPPRP